MGNKPKVQEDVVSDEGASPETNPEGRTPHGIPEEAADFEPAAKPTNERFATETAPLRIEKGEAPLPKR